MFVAVYRMRLKPGLEAQYAEAWHDATQVAIDQFGSGGSALFKAGDGTWVAIARWPDRESRQRFFDRDVDPVVRERQAATVVEYLPTLELDCVDDMWVPLPGV